MAKNAVREPRHAKKAKHRGRGVLDLPKALEERMAEGRAEREAVPLEAHAEWTAPGDRADPVGILEEQDATRVPELVPIRHGRMIVSPFTFYRGGAAIMASRSLAHVPSTGLRVQCCGDAHLSNFGVFAAPDRRLVFDLNDFDETLPAPFEWDVKRLVASIVVAARDNGHRPKHQRAAARACRRGLPEDRWRRRRRCASSTSGTRASTPKNCSRSWPPRRARPTVKAAQKDLAKARKRTSLGSLAKFAERVNGGYRIREQPPVIVRPPESTADEIEQIVRQGLPTTRARWLRIGASCSTTTTTRTSRARSSASAPSGTEAFMVLLMGDREDDPLFLQIKEAEHVGARAVRGRQRVRAPGRAGRAAASG